MPLSSLSFDMKWVRVNIFFITLFFYWCCFPWHISFFTKTCYQFLCSLIWQEAEELCLRRPRTAVGAADPSIPWKSKFSMAAPLQSSPWTFTEEFTSLRSPIIPPLWFPCNEFCERRTLCRAVFVPFKEKNWEFQCLLCLFQILNQTTQGYLSIFEYKFICCTCTDELPPKQN